MEAVPSQRDSRGAGVLPGPVGKAVAGLGRDAVADDPEGLRGRGVVFVMKQVDETEKPIFMEFNAGPGVMRHNPTGLRSPPARVPV